MPYSSQHKRETRQRILESARRQFNSRGFAQVSIDEIMEWFHLSREQITSVIGFAARSLDAPAQQQVFAGNVHAHSL